MRVIFLSLLTALLTLVAIPVTNASAKDATVQQNIYSLTCNIDLVYDGLNETYLITPEECDRPPSPEVPEQEEETATPVTNNPAGSTSYPGISLADIPTERLPNGGIAKPTTVPGIHIQQTGDVAHTDTPVEASIATAAVAVGVFVVLQIALLQFNAFEVIGRFLRSLISKP